MLEPLTCEALVGAHLLRAGGILVKAVVVVCVSYGNWQWWPLL